jgi:hypothetical protein
VRGIKSRMHADWVGSEIRCCGDRRYAEISRPESFRVYRSRNQVSLSALLCHNDNLRLAVTENGTYARGAFVSDCGTSKHGIPTTRKLQVTYPLAVLGHMRPRRLQQQTYCDCTRLSARVYACQAILKCSVAPTV